MFCIFCMCLIVSFSFCFLAKKLYHSSVLFLGFTNACSQLFFRSVRAIVATRISGNLSVRLFLAAHPNDKNSTLTIFRSAACSFRLFINDCIVGCRAVTVRNSSFTDIEYFALSATIKRSHHSLHSVLGVVSVEFQNAGNPDTADDPPDVVTSPPADVSRNAMLKGPITITEL